MALDKKSQYVVDGTDQVYIASTQAGVTMSLALSATQTGFTLTNPAGSGKNLVVLDTTVAFTTAPAGASTVVYAANVNPIAAAVTQTTPLTVRSGKLGINSTGVGLAASSVTLPAAPVVVRAIGGPVAASQINPPQLVDHVDGALVVTPGCALSVTSLTTAAVAVISMSWREVDAFA